MLPPASLATSLRVVKELGRAIALPARCLLYLPQRHRWQQQAAALLEAAGSLDPDEIARRNEEARDRFRAHLGPLRRMFISCGEHSGEGHARALVDALRPRLPDLEIVGFGGRLLEEAGVRLIENLVDLATMGASQVLANIGFYIGVVRRYIEWIERERPDVVVLLDSPGLHVILAEEAHARGIPVLYYICPQYWGWAPWRIGRFRRAVDGAIAILPFERPLFEAQGIPTGYAGNPLRTRIPDLAPEPRPPVLALLPGSRRAEITRHLPAMLDVWRRFKLDYPEARAVLPQQNPRLLARVESMLADTPNICDLELHSGGAFEVLSQVRLALVKSGTTTLQTALCRTPQVVVYNLSSAAEAWMAGRFLTVPWIAAPNLILGRDAVPEFLFSGESRWPIIGQKLRELWNSGYARDRQLAACDEVRRRTDGPGATAEAVRWLSG